LEMLPGPWEVADMPHPCPPDCTCGRTKEKAVFFIVELLIWLFSTLMPVAPNLARWVTLGPSCSWLGMCTVVHGVFQRAWLLAFAAEAADNDADGQIADEVGEIPFVKVLGRRVAKAIQ
jgi:hypothetical protein